MQDNLIGHLDKTHYILLFTILLLLLYIIRQKIQYKPYLLKEEKNLSSSAELVEDFKIQNNDILTLYKPFQLSSFLHLITNKAFPSLELYQHQLYYDIDPNISRYIISDFHYLEQLLNIMLRETSQLNKNSEIIVNITINNNKLHFTVQDKNLLLTKKEHHIFTDITLKNSSFLKASTISKALNADISFTSNKQEGTQFFLSLPYIKDQNAKRNIDKIQKKLLHKKALFIAQSKKEIEIITKMFTLYNIQIDTITLTTFMAHKPHLNTYNFIILKSKNLTPLHLNFFKNQQKNNLTIIVIHDISEPPKQKKASNEIADISLYHPLISGDLEEKFYHYFVLEEHQNIHHQELSSKEIETFIIRHKSKSNKKDLEKFKGNSILVAQNSTIEQKIIKYILTIQGLEVTFCFNGQEVLEILNDKHIDIIFMNAYMPILDGIKATKKIRKILDYEDIPIIALGSSYFEHELLEMKRAGINAYLQKPINAEQFYQALETFLKVKTTSQKTLTPLKEHLFSKTYIINHSILNIEKGIEDSINEEFYKELLVNTLDALKDSYKTLKIYYEKKEFSKLQNFLLNTLPLYQNIYATTMSTTIEGMLYLLNYHRESGLANSVILYEKNWNTLNREVEKYLYSISSK